MAPAPDDERLQPNLWADRERQVLPERSYDALDTCPGIVAVNYRDIKVELANLSGNPTTTGHCSTPSGDALHWRSEQQSINPIEPPPPQSLAGLTQTGAYFHPILVKWERNSGWHIRLVASNFAICFVFIDYSTTMLTTALRAKIQHVGPSWEHDARLFDASLAATGSHPCDSQHPGDMAGGAIPACAYQTLCVSERPAGPDTRRAGRTMCETGSNLDVQAARFALGSFPLNNWTVRKFSI